MMRPWTIAAVGVGLLLLGPLTYRQEFASRYHLDTLRRESYRTTRIFGVPIARRLASVQDDYAHAYSTITGTEPAGNRWLQRPVDCVRTLSGETDRCYGFSSEFRDRRDLLEAVYKRFPAKLSRAQAAAYVRRIDELVPADFGGGRETDFEQVHLLRKELRLRSFYDTKAE